MVTDSHGIYIMVYGFINGLPFTFLNVYGPNTDDPNFYKKVFDLLSDGNNTNIVIRGDLNGYLWRFSTAWYGTVRFTFGGFSTGYCTWYFLVPPRPGFQAIRTVTKT